MTNIEKIKAETKRLKKILEKSTYYLDNSQQALGYSFALDDFDAFLDSLPEEKPSEDLEVSEDTMSNEKIDKWVEEHIVVPPDDELSEARRQIYADIVPSIIEWGKIIAHKFYELGKKHNQLNKL